MSVILVSDIFGMTPALVNLKDKLGANTIVDPYDGECMDFTNEVEAYSYFMSNVGLDSYLLKLIKVLEPVESPTTLIGFSVGAAAIWRLSLNNNNNMIKEAFCFYGSQIRNFTQITPCFKINLIFPKHEVHFDVISLKETLAIKDNVTTTQVEYLHGFMNDYSPNFNKIAYQEHTTLLQSMVS